MYLVAAPRRVFASGKLCGIPNTCSSQPVVQLVSESIAPFDEIEVVPQWLLDAAAYGASLDVVLLDAAGSQAHASDRPLHPAPRFPPAHVLGIDAEAAA